ncbi:SDR family NAD(P)-dependent oxidoreductase [Catenulispora yoronensis]
MVIGAGPGLGLSVARRFGDEGYAVALVSRSDRRHPDYLASLASVGIVAEAYVADVTDRGSVAAVLDRIRERFGAIDVLYYGPAIFDPAKMPTSIEHADADSARTAMESVYPALDVVAGVLPAMLERGSGGLLFAGGLSAVRPMPMMGALALSSAALRTYVTTLNEALVDSGVYAGIVTIGGLIEGGDIHAAVRAHRGDQVPTLDPAGIAETVWQLFAKRDKVEAVVVGL